MKVTGIYFVLFITFIVNIHGQSFLKTSGRIAYSFYHNTLSPLRASVSQCQFYPSCSNFSEASINEFGFIKGVLISADRLMRCSGGHLYKSNYPRIKKLFLDPPENNFLFGKGDLWIAGTYSSQSISDKSSDDTILKNNNIFGFPKLLFLNNDFELSILELKRIQYLNNDNYLSNKSNLLISLNYLKKKDLDACRSQLDLIESQDKIINFHKAILSIILSDIQRTYLWNNNFLIKELSLKHIDTITSIRFMTYNKLRLNEIDSAKFFFNQHLKLNKDSMTNNIFDDFQKISTRSPFLAGIFSVLLPGSGYIYCGEIQEGLSAFLINGLIGWGIYSLFKNDNTGSGILTSLVAIPFYFGNILGSINAAYLYNNKNEEEFFNKLRYRLKIDYYFSLDYFKSLWQ